MGHSLESAPKVLARAFNVSVQKAQSTVLAYFVANRSPNSHRQAFSRQLRRRKREQR
jgi:hypothetical protein